MKKYIRLNIEDVTIHIHPKADGGGETIEVVVPKDTKIEAHDTFDVILSTLRGSKKKQYICLSKSILEEGAIINAMAVRKKTKIILFN